MLGAERVKQNILKFLYMMINLNYKLVVLFWNYSYCEVARFIVQCIYTLLQVSDLTTINTFVIG